jgi:hypothetical protein
MSISVCVHLSSRYAAVTSILCQRVLTVVCTALSIVPCIYGHEQVVHDSAPCVRVADTKATAQFKVRLTQGHVSCITRVCELSCSV